MASSSTSLYMMTKLSPYVFTYEPSETRTASSVKTSGPKVILLLAWMDARDVRIAMYITRYQSIYPNATIILVKFAAKETMITSLASGAVQPAVFYLHSLIIAGHLSANPKRPEILAHALSNGGATSMRNIYVNYNRLFGQPFPLHCMVFDSCPGHLEMSSSFKALMVGIPPGFLRSIAAPFIVLMVVASWIWHSLFGFIAGEDFLSTNWRVLNDQKLVKQTNRTYIYGKEDIIVDWRHIVNHADLAASKHFEVREEEFHDSPHVFHMNTHSERYWRVVQDTWKEAISLSR
ncbi:hypothetical protein F4861DRAFT_445505 [Xylaria intraflava]|nr:hypothetical protein F4861DRAFT_445505 [Xylaria intraflava]